jgi:hypothetical protein
MAAIGPKRRLEMSTIPPLSGDKTSGEQAKNDASDPQETCGDLATILRLRFVSCAVCSPANRTTHSHARRRLHTIGCYSTRSRTTSKMTSLPSASLVGAEVIVSLFPEIA